MILDISISLLAVAGFAAVLWLGRIQPVVQKCLSTTVTGLGAMMDRELDDESKEAAVRKAGLDLVVSAFGIAWRLAAALGAAALPIFVADMTGIARSDAILSLMLRLDYIVIVSILAIVVVRYARRHRTGSRTVSSGSNRYSAADRFFHILAFSSPVILKMASRLEDFFFSKSILPTTTPPIFVTSLARGGTTALLNALYDVPDIATHTYRDMPFVTAPLLWNRVTGGKQRAVERHQRAHGDGLEIDLDSPEAFEEVLWKIFWPRKYAKNSISLWDAAISNPSAEAFIGRQFCKVVAARQSQGKTKVSHAARYCSKNNANIARIPYLLKTFPGCQIVVPVRRPESHSASLLRQHENFVKQQTDDAFVRRYMQDIGHFEFGLIHKPIAFSGFDADKYNPATPDYWLAYWICVFQNVLQYKDTCTLVFQEDLRANPQSTMEALCSDLDLDAGGADFASYFLSKADSANTDQFNPDLLRDATKLYEQLRAER